MGTGGINNSFENFGSEEEMKRLQKKDVWSWKFVYW